MALPCPTGYREPWNLSRMKKSAWPEVDLCVLGLKLELNCRCWLEDPECLLTPKRKLPLSVTQEPAEQLMRY